MASGSRRARSREVWMVPLENETRRNLNFPRIYGLRRGEGAKERQGNSGIARGDRLMWGAEGCSELQARGNIGRTLLWSEFEWFLKWKMQMG